MTHTRCEESANYSRAGVAFISNILLTSCLRWDLQRTCARARFNSKEQVRGQVEELPGRPAGMCLDSLLHFRKG